MSSRREYPLNCLEKNMLAWEREGLSFNSHFVLDFAAPLEIDRVRSAIQILFEEIPILRTRIFEQEGKAKRFAADSLWFDPYSRIEVLDSIEEDREEAFLNRPFKLDEEPPFRVLLGKKGDYFRLILSIHHTAGDGMAQAYLLNEFFRAYNGESLTPWAREYLPFRYRDFFRQHIPVFRFFKLALAGIFGFFEKRVPAATIMDHREAKSRRVAISLYDLDEKKLTTIKARADSMKLGIQEFLIYAIARAFHRESIAKGDQMNPVTLAIPINFRPPFRINRYFQNVVGMVRLVIPRHLLTESGDLDTFKSFVESKLNAESAFRVIFQAALANFFLGLDGLRKKLKAVDEDPQVITASAIFSYGRLPASMAFPHGMRPERIFGRGALFKSPGIGIILTGEKRRQTLVVEYISEAFEASTLSKFAESLFEELGLRSLN